jgi:type VI secretion system secreted protein Hcp
MANVDYFLRIDGIQGGSIDSKHKGEIDIESFGWGEQNTPSPGGGGGGAGKVNMRDFHFVARTNKASPVLLVACASGQHFKSATLTGRSSQKASLDFLTVSFTDVLVSSYDIGSAQDALPADQFSLNFATILMQFKEQKPDGSVGATVSGGWDLKNNKKI